MSIQLAQVPHRYEGLTEQHAMQTEIVNGRQPLTRSKAQRDFSINIAFTLFNDRW